MILKFDFICINSLCKMYHVEKEYTISSSDEEVQCEDCLEAKQKLLGATRGIVKSPASGKGTYSKRYK